MFSFLARLLGREEIGSKHVAKERLRLVLVHDRASVSPQLLQALKEDILRVVSNYVEVDEKNLEVQIDRTDRAVALVASIPIKRLKRVAKSLA